MCRRINAFKSLTMKGNDKLHEAYICLGSNEPDAAARVGAAASRLSALVEEEAFSGAFATRPAPPADPDGPEYVNAVMRVSSPLSLRELQQLLKDLEAALGRRSEHKQSGRVVIDLDVVVYDGEVCRVAEFASSYFMHGYRLCIGSNTGGNPVR